MTVTSTERRLIIAIDGPSGAGKSTLTKMLAERLGYIYVDTGAMFRAIALCVSRSGIDPTNDTALAELCNEIDLRFARDNGEYRIICNGEDVSAAIRTPEISLLTSRVSARKVVRDHLLLLQRKMGAQGGVILEGRDIGTVVFPGADLKIFLSASPEERGRRRFLELKAKGELVSLEETIAAVIQRDRQDEEREHAPLRKADDAIEIDSSTMGIEEVLNRLVAIASEKVRQLR